MPLSNTEILKYHTMIQEGGLRVPDFTFSDFTKEVYNLNIHFSNEVKGLVFKVYYSGGVHGHQITMCPSTMDGVLRPGFRNSIPPHGIFNFFKEWISYLKSEINAKEKLSSNFNDSVIEDVSYPTSNQNDLLSSKEKESIIEKLDEIKECISSYVSEQSGKVNEIIEDIEYLKEKVINENITKKDFKLLGMGVLASIVSTVVIPTETSKIVWGLMKSLFSYLFGGLIGSSGDASLLA